MSAKRLRDVAASMRERAEAVDLSPARVPDGDLEFSWTEQIRHIVADPDASHLTTFGYPAVALAVADLLDDGATYLEYLEREHPDEPRSDYGRFFLAVADAYLGGES